LQRVCLTLLAVLFLMLDLGWARAKPALQVAKSVAPKAISFEITDDYPHDPQAFTQGLEVWGGEFFLESTGQYGKSDVRKVHIRSGRVEVSSPLDASYFGEGVTRRGSEIFQLTWREGQILKWSFSSKYGFKLVGKSPWVGEGWGLTKGRGALWVSDGSSVIREVRLPDFTVTRKITVTLNGSALGKINELEWVDGRIFANVWMTSMIVRINPDSGVIDGLLDLSTLIPKGLSTDAVANGIAWHPSQRRLYVTGKFWPKVYALRLLER
jgi:glutamine cyclotransferase